MTSTVPVRAADGLSASRRSVYASTVSPLTAASIAATSIFRMVIGEHASDIGVKIKLRGRQ
jgi:hypothetical protein